MTEIRDPMAMLSRTEPFWLTYRAKRIAHELLNAYCGAVPRLARARGVLRRHEARILTGQAYRALEELVAEPHAALLLPRTSRELSRTKRVPETLCTLYGDLEEAYMSVPGGGAESVGLTELPCFDPAQRRDPSERTALLLEICREFQENAELFRFVLLNGSIGSDDDRPGWSDIDIFCVISGRTMQSPGALAAARYCITRANALGYLYNILQLHGVFVSTEPDLQFQVPSDFPLVCLPNGKLLTWSGLAVDVRPGPVRVDGYVYFYRDILTNSRRLLNKRARSPMEIALLMHRIYAFPFAFLQCEGVSAYKRESFDLLIERCAGLLPGASDLFREGSSLYRGWAVDRLTTVRARRLGAWLAAPKRVNQRLLGMERDINSGLARMGAWLDAGAGRRFHAILDAADGYLWSRFPQVIAAESYRTYSGA